MVDTVVEKASGGSEPSIETSVSRMASCTTGGADCVNFCTSSGGGIDLTNWKSSLSSVPDAAEMSRLNSESREPSSLRPVGLLEDAEVSDDGPASLELLESFDSSSSSGDGGGGGVPETHCQRGRADVTRDGAKA